MMDKQLLDLQKFECSRSKRVMVRLKMKIGSDNVDQNSRSGVVGWLVMMASWFYKDLPSDTRRVPRRRFKKRLRVPRRISGVNSPRCLSRIATLLPIGPSRTAMGP
ncbi:hypothetical protein E3N88_17612 [Mikania micrantha]|uniref:Uncharacterized protein n=1 Tax=Mikania micrantha TaxID=192012 RepID=A0A5N6NSC6_9ASTR|nr:hypothetical protein E3N88_17612 [Mikania micrantha]